MLLRPVDLKPATEFVQRSERQVDAQILCQQQALALSILAQIGDTGLQAGVDMRKVHRFAVDADDAAAGPQADETFHQFRPPGADEAGKAENLALPQLERGLLREAGDGKILDLQDGFPGELRVAVRIKLGHVATNHQTRHVDRL